jgi:hypothetical protein
MEIKSIVVVLAGITILYAGVLTLADDLETGVGMIVLGGMLAAMLLWKPFRRWYSRADTRGGSPKSGEGKKRVHLKAVDGNHEDRPTYH